MQTIHCQLALTARGWERDIAVTIDDRGYITALTKGEEHSDGYRVDCLLPAPLNLHSHAFQRAMSGLTEKRGPGSVDSFWTWRKLMYKFLDQLTPDQIEAIAAQVFMEMLEAGYGAVAEFHYLHHALGGKPYADIAELSRRIIRAAEHAGIGLTLLPVLYSYGGCDKRPLQGGQLRFCNDFSRYQVLYAEASKAIMEADCQDYTIGVAPHSLRAVGEEDVRSCAVLAGSAPFHMHLAEQIPEVDEVLAAKGARPVEWLLDTMDVSENACFIHVTQMNAAETRRLARTGAVAGLCPITESNLGDGIFNGTDYLAAGGRFGVGSDSNVHISLFEELKTLDYSQRLRDHSRAALATPEFSAGRVAYDQVSRSGAQAGGRNSGSIEVGKLADLLAIERDNAWLCNRSGDSVLDSLIFGGHGRDCVTDVWSAGRHRVKNRCHIAREKIQRAYIDTCKELGEDI